MSNSSSAMSRRSLLTRSAVAGAGGSMLLASSGAFGAILASGGTAIRPFRAAALAADLADLRRRIAMTRWPERENVADHSQGVQLAKLRPLVEYWGTAYDCISSSGRGAQ